MATVTRQDGTEITINDAITKTSFASIATGNIITQNYIDSLTTAISKLEGYAAKVDNCGVTNCCESCQDSCTCQSSKNQSCQNSCACQSSKNQGCQNTCTNCTNGDQGCQNSCTNQGCQNSCTNQGCQSTKNQGCQSSGNQSCQSVATTTINSTCPPCTNGELSTEQMHFNGATLKIKNGSITLPTYTNTTWSLLFWLYQSASGMVHANNGAGSVCLEYNNGGTCGGCNCARGRVTSRVNASLNTWHHLYLGYNGTTIYFGMDGTVYSGSYSSSATPPASISLEGTNYIDDIIILAKVQYTANYTLPTSSTTYTNKLADYPCNQ